MCALSWFAQPIAVAEGKELNGATLRSGIDPAAVSDVCFAAVNSPNGISPICRKLSLDDLPARVCTQSEEALPQGQFKADQSHSRLCA